MPFICSFLFHSKLLLLVFVFLFYPAHFYWLCGSVLNSSLFILLPTLVLIFNLKENTVGTGIFLTENWKENAGRIKSNANARPLSSLLLYCSIYSTLLPPNLDIHLFTTLSFSSLASSSPLPFLFLLPSPLFFSTLPSISSY